MENEEQHFLLLYSSLTQMHDPPFSFILLFVIFVPPIVAFFLSSLRKTPHATPNLASSDDDPNPLLESGQDELKKKKKRKGKKKKTNECLDSDTRPESECLNPFTSSSSVMQKKIKPHYDELVKCNHSNKLTLSQVYPTLLLLTYMFAFNLNSFNYSIIYYYSNFKCP